MQKKLSSLFTIFILAFCMLAGCASSDSNKNNEKDSTVDSSNPEKTPQIIADINIGCMKGPTAIGMINMMSDSDEGLSKNHYNYTISGTADEMSAALLNGNIDVAAVPCNLASVLYNKTEGEIVTVAINTLGVLYIVEAGNTISEVKDLAGKTIFSAGQGTTPEYTLRYLLSKAGLDPDNDVTIEYKFEATEVVAALAQNPDAIAMLPQPYVTVAIKNNDKIHIALDITKEWETLTDGNTVVTGVIVARKKYIEENKEAFSVFMQEYKESTDNANSNIDKTADLLEKYDVFKADIAKEAIPYCNVTYVDGEEMQNKMLDYLSVLYEQNPASIGGKLPEEGIFYIEGNNKQ